MKTNVIREALKADKPTFATRVLSTWPSVTEMVGATGFFDYVEFPVEYMPFDQADLENIARAAELHNMGSMIKVDFTNRFYVAQKAVSSGFQAVLFADHKTPDEVRETIKFMKSDTPFSNGRFGFPCRRYIGYQPTIPLLDHAKRVDDLVMCFMIEKKEAMDNIEEICSIPGVDMVQFGPYDYSLNHGKDINEFRQECRDAEKRMIEVALKHGVAPRCEVYGKPEDILYYQSLGVKHVCYGDEIMSYNDYLQSACKKARELVK